MPVILRPVGQHYELYCGSIHARASRMGRQSKYGKKESWYLKFPSYIEMVHGAFLAMQIKTGKVILERFSPFTNPSPGFVSTPFSISKAVSILTSVNPLLSTPFSWPSCVFRVSPRHPSSPPDGTSSPLGQNAQSRSIRHCHLV